MMDSIQKMLRNEPAEQVGVFVSSPRVQRDSSCWTKGGPRGVGGKMPSDLRQQWVDGFRLYRVGW